MIAFSLYMGKSAENKDFRLGGDVIILHLIELGELPPNNGIKLYFDYYVTSLRLIRHLKKLDYYATGTLRDQIIANLRSRMGI